MNLQDKAKIALPLTADQVQKIYNWDGPTCVSDGVLILHGSCGYNRPLSIKPEAGKFSEYEKSIALLRRTTDRFKLGHGRFAFMQQWCKWLVAADWIEGEGDEVLAAEMRRLAERTQEIGSYFTNPCACGGGLDVISLPSWHFKTIWKCRHCLFDTGARESWLERIVVWNLMNPQE